jgi:hypothetical protein
LHIFGGLGGDDFDFASLVQDLQTYQISSPLQKQIDTSVSHSQIPDPEFGNRFREVRAIEANLFSLCIQRETQAGLQ